MMVRGPGNLPWSEMAGVARAEFFRHVRAAPVSFWAATVLFPFATVVALFFAPRMRAAQWFQILPAGYTVHDGAGREPDPPRAEMTRQLIEAIADQPYYHLTAVADARAAFQRGTLPVAIELTWTPGATGTRPGAPHTPATRNDIVMSGGTGHDGASLTLRVLRHDDFWSRLFLRHVRRVARRPPIEDTADVLVPRASKTQSARRASRSGLIEAAPFILIGFAWFFLTVGVVEGFVVDRERRTLEVLLSAPVSREGLAGGKLAFILLEVVLAEGAGVAGFIAVGFSPWLLSIFALLIVTTVPAAILSFLSMRNMDDAMRAGWRNGVVFMIGFPIVILGDEVAGRWSPLYQLSQAFHGPPPAGWYLGLLAVSVAGSLVALSYFPAIVRGWAP